MIPLIKNCNSDYSIVISEKPSKSQRWAANQLQKYLKEISSVEIPIKERSTISDRKTIILGNDEALLSSYLSQEELESLGIEGFHIKTIKDTLIIAGSEIRGTIYGVFSFLEAYLNCRFYSPNFEKIPKMSSITLPEIDDKQLPDFDYRLVTYMNLMEPHSSAKLKCNMNFFSEEKYGGSFKFSMQHMTHTFYQLIPPAKYYQDHPEYFALVNGKRQSFDAQLCLTNPNVIDISIQRVKKWIENDPYSRSFGIVQNDVDRYCRCDKCKALDEKEDSHAGSLLYFVNNIAQAIKEDYPDKFIHTIAYTYTEKPPKIIKPEENVIVVVCNMYPICLNHSIQTCPKNARFKRHLNGWLQLTENVLVWHYITDFKHYVLPFPNFSALAEDLAYYKNIGVKGFLGQAGFTDEQEFQNLRNYYLLKLCWNVQTT